MILCHIPRNLRAEHYRLFFKIAMTIDTMATKLRDMGGTRVMSHMVMTYGKILCHQLRNLEAYF